MSQASEPAAEGTVDSPQLSPQELKGHSVAKVKEVLGRPQGKFRTQDGEIWLYADWQVHLDNTDTVVSVDPEIPVKVEAGPGRPAAGPVPPIRVVTNGGQQLDLLALMPAGKVTIVDFYADWCGPCRQISPHLEGLAKSDPDVVLVKVDIVKWGTPVTRQYHINSVPNMRVFDRRSQAVGQPTSDFNAVQRYVAQAKKG